MVEKIDSQEIEEERRIISIYMKNIKEYLKARKKPIVL